MKNIRNILILLIILAGVWYFTTRTDSGVIETPTEISDDQTTFIDSGLGLEFKYPSGAEGYVLEEGGPEDLAPDPKPKRIIRLFKKEDYESYKNPPEGGEGPPAILIQVFENKNSLSPEAWANENMALSNINLKIGEVAKDAIGGSEAIRYMADGLYASENAVVANGNNVYVFVGQFLDEDSDLRRDFEPILDSVQFISNTE